MIETFRPHARSKLALAMLYFPHEKPYEACRHLMRWINGCPPLMRSLHELDYRTHQRHFTAAQVKRIVHYLGEPESSEVEKIKRSFT